MFTVQTMINEMNVERQMTTTHELTQNKILNVKKHEHYTKPNMKCQIDMNILYMTYINNFNTERNITL